MWLTTIPKVPRAVAKKVLFCKDIMKKLLSLAGLIFCLITVCFSRSAQADTIKTFELAGIYSPALYGTGVANGSFTVNTTTGAVLSIDFDYVGRFANQLKDPNVYVSTYNGLTELGVGFGTNGGGVIPTGISILVPVTTFIGYTGGFICSIANPCTQNSYFYNPLGRQSPFQSGTLGVTPEPPSFSYVLLSVVCLASLPFVRKRLMA